MPYGDGTGPRGMGPRTGRGFGYCTGYNAPGYAAGPGFGRGFGRGWGRGLARSPGWGYAPAPRPITQAEEKAMLEQDRAAVEDEIKYLRQELEEIKSLLGKKGKK